MTEKTKGSRMSANINLRWQGTASLEFSVGKQILAVDPFFTRPSLGETLLRPLRTDSELAAAMLPRCDHVLISHPHYDHLMDVPDVIGNTNALVYGSPNSCALLSTLGAPGGNLNTMIPGDHLALGDIRVEVLLAKHRTLFGQRLATGTLKTDLNPPFRATDYRMDMCYSFGLVIEGMSFFIASGLGDDLAPPAEVLLVAPYGEESDFKSLLEGVQPRLVIPIHWDDFFRPLSKPLRMMRDPSNWKWPPLRRVDLNDFERIVKAYAPHARLLIPEVFEHYDIRSLLSA
jgi:L-ascorbate metabolism protein UlaG (beta-lactamase superfamily)